MHEFEAMLFSDCDGFARGVGPPEIASSLQAIREHYGCPEDIDDSPDSAPSTRVETIVSKYEKPLLGVLGRPASQLTRHAC